MRSTLKRKPKGTGVRERLTLLVVGLRVGGHNVSLGLEFWPLLGVEESLGEGIMLDLEGGYLESKG